MLTVAEARYGIDEFTDIRRDMVVLKEKEECRLA